MLEITEFHVWVPEHMRGYPPPSPYYYYDPYYFYFDPYFVNPYFYPYW